MSHEDAAALLHQCPKSCKLCHEPKDAKEKKALAEDDDDDDEAECVDDPDFRDETGASCAGMLKNQTPALFYIYIYIFCYVGGVYVANTQSLV